MIGALAIRVFIAGLVRVDFVCLNKFFVMPARGVEHLSPLVRVTR